MNIAISTAFPAIAIYLKFTGVVFFKRNVETKQGVLNLGRTLTKNFVLMRDIY